MSKKPTIAEYSILILSFATIPLFSWFGKHIRINHTASLPPGIYWANPVTSTEIQRGDMVIACPPHRFLLYASRKGQLSEGECQGLETMLKIAVGMPGDHIQLNQNGVTINNHYLPHSRPFPTSTHGERVPHVPYGKYVLHKDEYWLGTPNPRSFDSRYYGPVRDIRAHAYAVITSATLPWLK